MRPHPYFRPKGHALRALPYFAGYFALLMGVLAGLSSLGVPLHPLLVVPGLIAVLVLGANALSGPPLELPRGTALGSAALMIGGGFLLEHDESLAPILIAVALLFLWWMRRLPLLPERESPGNEIVDRAAEDGISSGPWIDPSAQADTDNSDLVLPTPTPWSRPIGRRRQSIFLSTHRMQITLGLVSLGATALGLLVLYASVFGSGPAVARVIGGVIGAVILLIGASGLITALLDLTRRIVVDAAGLRLTNLGGWRFTWDEIGAVALVLGADKRAPVSLAVALAPMAPRHISYAPWTQIAPFTHLAPLRGDRDSAQLRAELVDALSWFVPDLYLGELTPPQS